ncbi:MAG: hypothetical protein HY670_01490 [Chloroflexi bacterium]|nr:hypothetical protein [Chloroflexota bacterium]
METLATHAYLAIIRDNLRLEYATKMEILRELRAHIEDKLEELKQAGFSEEEATRSCLKLLGSAKSVARQIYEAHSQGTWRQTMLAATPHLLFALLFALNWWQVPGWRLVALALILITAIYGWWHGKPTWLFPWLGCTLMPVVLAGVALFYLPVGWSWIVIILYIPLALWLFCHLAVQAIRRDWLYGSLILLPAPVIAGWFLAATAEGRFPGFGFENPHYFAPWIGLTFLVLGLTVGLFVRLRQRWLKGTVLFLSGVLTVALVAFYNGGKLGLPTFLFLVLASAGLFLAPALLERGVRHREQREV